MSTVREVTCDEAPAALRCVLLHRPDAHPLWHSYVVSLVHLRPLEGWGPAHLQFADASHEIGIFAIDPECTPDPDVPKTIVQLSPPNLIYQLRGRTDETARAVFAAFVQALATREMNPDTDHRQCQIAWLDRWGKAS